MPSPVTFEFNADNKVIAVHDAVTGRLIDRPLAPSHGRPATRHDDAAWQLPLAPTSVRVDAADAPLPIRSAAAFRARLAGGVLRQDAGAAGPLRSNAAVRAALGLPQTEPRMWPLAVPGAAPAAPAAPAADPGTMRFDATGPVRSSAEFRARLGMARR